MGTKVNSNYESLLTFTRASKGHALRPVSYGDELVTNGTFDTDSDWTKSSTGISGGVATVTIGYRFLVQDAGLQTGKLYYISFDYTETSSSKLRVNTTGTNGAQQALLTTVSGTGSGTIQGAVVAEGPYIAIEAGSAAFTGTIDNVSVKEVTFDESDGTLTLFEHPAGIPRVEYDADGNRLGLLVEELRTNAITNSESCDFVDENGGTVTASTTSAPYGMSSTVKRVQSATLNGGGRLPVTVITGGNNSCSVYVRSRTGADQNLKITASGTTGATQVAPASGDWVRLGRVASLGAGSRDMRVLSTGDTIDLDIALPQLEAGSFPTSYIKTTGNTKDRAADVASIPVADFGYNQSAGTMFVEASTNAPLGSRSNDGVFSLQKDNDDLHRVYLPSNDDLNWQMRQGGSTVFATSIITDIVKGQEFKVSLSWHSGSQDASYDGNVATNFGTGTTMADSAVDLNIGYINTTDYLNGHIKSIKYYPRRLTNAQLQDLTS